MKKLLIFLFILITIPVGVLAYSINTNDSIIIPKEEVHEGSLYAVGQAITIDGMVIGDLFCAGQTVTINGEIDGDVICAAQSIVINGKVNGDVRAVGSTLSIQGIVEKNATLFGADVQIGNSAFIRREVFVVAASANVLGKVGKDLHGAVSYLFVGGDIGGDVKFILDDRITDDTKGIEFKKEGKSSLTVSKDATIAGNVYYKANQVGVVEEGATVNGEIKHSFPEYRKTKGAHVYRWIYSLVYWIFASLVVGLVLVSLWKEKTLEIIKDMSKEVPARIGWGSIVLLLTPLIAVILLVTFIGIPLALLVVVCWLIAMFLSKIYVAIFVGQEILKKYFEKKKYSLVWAMIVGVVVSWILFNLPLIGWAFSVMALVWGLGTLWLYLQPKKKA